MRCPLCNENEVELWKAVDAWLNERLANATAEQHDLHELRSIVDRYKDEDYTIEDLQNHLVETHEMSAHEIEQFGAQYSRQVEAQIKLENNT